MAATSRAPRLTPALIGILVALSAALLLSSGTTHAAPVVTTDKADYAPNEIVVITGSGFNNGDVLDIVVTRPDASIVKGDGSFEYGWDTATAGPGGTFTYNYQLNGILGTYTIDVYASPWNGPDSYDIPLASTTFTDFTSTTLKINNAAYSTDALAVTLKVGWSGDGGDPTQARFVNDLSPEADCTNLGGGVWGPWTTLTEIGTTNTATFSWTMATDTSTGYRQVCSEVAQGSLGSPTNKKGAKDQIFYRLPNPSLGSACGFDMVLVIDSSGSIDSVELAQMKSALSSFVTAFLPSTPTEIAVVEFDTSASVTQGFTSNTTLLNNAINAAASGGYTNWDDAMADARGLLPNRAANPDIIVFASDGNPNRRGGHTVLGHSSTVSSVTETQAMAWATAEANAAKTSGARIISLGIGTDLDSNNMIAISGPTVSPPAPVDANVDVIKSGFSTLASSLASLAEGLCGGTVTVHKVIDADGNTATTADQISSGNTVAGWTFTPTVSGGSSTPASDSTDSTGIAGAFDIPIASGTATVSVAETVKPGASLLAASCAGATGNGAFDGLDSVDGIVISPLNIVSCTFYNQPPPCPADDDDLDGDGLSNGHDPDDDNDGSSDVLDPDDDNDGMNDSVDSDDDNDAIPDDGDDFDGDELPGDQESDDDNDGVSDSSDPDDDNDGVPDSSDPDHDNDSGPDNEDDGDGDDDKPCTPPPCPNDDDDLADDGISNKYDPDDDNDGFPDSSDSDDDNDGVPDSSDSDDDNDGLPDDHDDFDGDGYPSGDDSDDDNDGVSDSSDPDDDNDGVPDASDPDHDNDGEPDDDDDDDGDDDCPNLADVKISSQTVSGPAGASTNSPFSITVQKTLHNNGPTTPVTAAISASISGPPDCTITPAAGNPTSIVLSGSVSTPVTEVFDISCTAPSAHQFSITNCISVTSPDIIDPNSGNNCAAPATFSLPITGDADAKVTGITMTGPPSSSAGSSFTVGADAAVHNNGPTGIVNVDTVLTLNLPSDCTTVSANPQTVQDTSKALSVVGNVSGSWNVTCTNPSTHSFTTTATTAVDQLHTTDPTTLNNTTTSGPRLVNILVTSDLKANSVTVSSPASSAVGSPFSVTASASVHNNGAYGPTSADTTFTLGLPGDCTTGSANPQTVQNTSLPTSTVTSVSGPAWSVTCTTPSSHTFAMAASVAVDQLHVSDPNSGNDSTSGSSSTSITATSDIKVNSVSVTSPAFNAAGVAFNVSASASEHNNGAYGPTNVDTTFTLTLPADCSTATNPQTIENTSLPFSTATPVTGPTWPVTCTSASNHSFSVSASAAIDQLHVTDPLSGNNSASGNSSTNITATSDIKVNTVTVGSPLSNAVGVAFSVTASAGLQNLGPYGPTNVDTTFTLSLPPDCSTSSTNPQVTQNTSLPASGSTTVSGISWTVTCSSPSSHSFPVTASVAVDQLHVSDPTATNDSAGSSSTTGITGEADVKVAGVSVSAPVNTATGAPFNVQVTATVHNNGAITPVNVDTMLSINTPLDCSKSPVGSQVIQDISIAMSIAAQVSQTWSVTCTVPSNHSFSGDAYAALDQLHVSDPASGNETGSGSASTSVTTTSDLKVNSVSVSSPASNAAGSAFNVTASASVHNNGGYGPTNADTTFTLSMPGDCTTSSANPQTAQNTSLPTSVATTVPAIPMTWAVTCTTASNHNFSATASIATDQIHVSDTTPGNNSASGGASTNITATSDIKVTGVSLTDPGTIPASTPFTVTSNAVLHNNGSYGPTSVDTSFTLSLPADCTTSSTNPQTVQNTSLPTSVATTVPASPLIWSVTCTDPSNHTISVTASATVDQLHVSDPTATNNTAGNSTVTSVTRTSDLKVNSVAVSSPVSNAAGSAFSVTASASVHNNGSYGPTNVDTTFTLSMPADCTTTSGNPQTNQDTSLPTSTATTVPASPVTWAVTCSSASSHGFSVTASAAIDQGHVTDPASGNDSASGGSSTNILGTSDVKVNSVTVTSPPSNIAGSAFNVTASASLHNNGTYGPTNVDTAFTLSLPGDCTTSSANPQTEQNTSLPISAAMTVPVSPITWSVICTTVSSHDFPVTASAAVDQLHVTDPASANDSAGGSSTTDIGSTADIKMTSVIVSSPPSSAGGSPFNVTASASAHDNGPYGPAIVDTTFTLTMPGDCTTSSANPQTTQDTSLATSIVTAIPGGPTSWSVTCTSPSDHSFSVTASAAIDQLHVADPTPGNNSAGGGSTTSINAVTDVKATSVTVTAPGSASAGTPFNVSATATLHNNGPISPANTDASFSISMPPDCTTTSGNPQAVQDTSLPVSTATITTAVTWPVTCTTPSSHQFTVTSTASVDQLHLSDSSNANDSASGIATTDVGSTADIKVNNVTVSAPPNANTGSAFSVTVNATIHNNGPLTPANVDSTFDLTLPADCTRTPNTSQTTQDSSLVASVAASLSQTWSVTCSDSSSHSFAGSATATEDMLHVNDPNLLNNSSTGNGSTAILGSSDVKVSSVSVSAPASASAGASFNVTVSANIHNNGTVNPVNTDTTLNLVVPGDCTRTPNGSQAVQDTALAPSVAAPVSATWSVSCSSSSNHNFDGSAAVSIDQLHVSDPTPGNDSGSGGATTAILAQADLKVSSVTVTAPASSSTGGAFNVTVAANLHNNGAGPVNADATLGLSVPADCTTTPGASQAVSNTSLATSTATPVSAVWSVTCSSPSSHQFNGNGTVTLDQLHVSDPTPSNNTGTGNATTAVTGQADIKVASVSVSAPASANTNTAFNVTINATLHNNGGITPVNVDTTADLSIPGDCTKTPGGSQVVNNTSLAMSTATPVSATWSVTCTGQSNHSFSGSASVAIDQQHVSDSNTANNSGAGGPVTTSVNASSDLKISSVSMSVPATLLTNTAFNVTVNSTMHNNGTFTPANADLAVSLTLPGDCTKTPNLTQDQQGTSLVASTAVTVSKTWSVTCTGSGAHTFSGSSTVTLDEVLHVTDPNTGNNTAGNSVSPIVGTPTPPPPVTPTPSPTVLGVGGTPVAVGGIVGLINEDGTPPSSGTSPSNGGGGLTLGALGAGMALVLAGAWATRRRLLG